MFRVVGRYELKASLGLTSACFGKRFGTRIAGRRVTMTLPRIDASGDRPSVLPPDVPDLPQYRGAGFVFQGGASSDRWGYGSVSSWNAATGKVQGGWLEGVALEFTVPDGSFDLAESTRTIGVPTGGVIGEFFDVVDGWFERLNDWAAVASDQDTYYSEPLTSFSTRGAGLTVMVVDGDGNVSSPASGNLTTVLLRESTALTLQKFRNVIRIVNGGEDPSEAHILLRDAYIALRRGHYRRATIDAGAAAEMCVAQWNRTHNSNLRPARGHPTLGWLVNQKGAPVPVGTTASLVRVRNAAIHQNLAPSASDALTAVNTARAIVHAGDPLPV